jgi:MFS family permease
MRLWSAQGISAIGGQMTILALPLTAVLVLQASAFEVVLLATAASVPYLVLGIPVGVWVDRVRRRPVMIAADVGRAAALASLPAAYEIGVLTLPHLYVVAVVNGSLSVCFEVASQAYLPSVVSRDQLIVGEMPSSRPRASSHRLPGLVLAAASYPSRPRPLRCWPMQPRSSQLA